MDTGTQEELAIFRKYDSDEDDDEVAEEKVAEEQKNETAPCNQAPTQHAAEAADAGAAGGCVEEEDKAAKEKRLRALLLSSAAKNKATKGGSQPAPSAGDETAERAGPEETGEQTRPAHQLADSAAPETGTTPENGKPATSEGCVTETCDAEKVLEEDGDTGSGHQAEKDVETLSKSEREELAALRAEVGALREENASLKQQNEMLWYHSHTHMHTHTHTYTYTHTYTHTHTHTRTRARTRASATYVEYARCTP